ncbi:MAG: response regulator [Tissierellaceae bacterium]
MKIYILDRSSQDRNALKRIILSNNLGSLAGESGGSEEALEEIADIVPDLLIFDLLGDQEKGFTLIESLRERRIKSNYLIISDMVSKEIVEKAYRHGIEYYICKPINDFEIKSVVKKIRDRVYLERRIGEIRQLFDDITHLPKQTALPRDCEADIKTILLRLGIVGEKGSKDILMVIRYIIENKVNMSYMTIRDICSKFTDNPRVMEQKMRRAINIALMNIASLGIEDYMNETFVEYSNTLFNFEQVKREMDYIRGKSQEKGSINMKKFITGIYIYCENVNR